jgi:polysaccharide biosynthesis protein PslG
MGQLIVGLDANVSGWGIPNMQGRLDQITGQTGAKWLREEFTWGKIEPSRGVFDFAIYDQLMLVAARKGVHILPTLMDTPGWDGPSWNAIPANPSDYARYVAAVVGRYGPHGSFWASHPALPNDAIDTFELWNEPYYPNGDDGNYSPARYANLVKAAATAGRNADPAARFLLAAENQSQYVGSTWVWWIQALYQAVPDLNKYFDGVAVHPYGDDLTSYSYPRVGQAYDGYEQIRRVEAIHQEFAGHGAADKPLWITEIGWPTCTGGSTRCTTPDGQASDLSTVLSYAHTTWRSYVHSVFVYHYEDLGTDSSDPENDYGLTTYTHAPKPALAVFRAAAATSA